MVRQSNYSMEGLIATVGRRMQAFQDATDEEDEAVAQRLRLNRTHLRSLSVLSQADSMTASALAEAAGLTRGAMTTALDRIERAGYVHRVWDQKDRREVRVEMTENAMQQLGVLYGPLAQAGLRYLRKYTAEELAAVVRYREDSCELQRAHAQRIRALGQTQPARDTRRQRRAREL